MRAKKNAAETLAKGTDIAAPTRGKIRPNLNAVKFGVYAKSGLLRGEDPRAYQAFRKQMFDELNPTNFLQNLIVNQMVWCAWHLLRLELT